MNYKIKKEVATYSNLIDQLNNHETNLTPHAIVYVTRSYVFDCLILIASYYGNKLAPITSISNSNDIKIELAKENGSFSSHMIDFLNLIPHKGHEQQSSYGRYGINNNSKKFFINYYCAQELIKLFLQQQT